MKNEKLYIGLNGADKIKELLETVPEPTGCSFTVVGEDDEKDVQNQQVICFKKSE